jgi:hypothetical protein
MMLLALTVERYVSVCHPGRTQPLIGPPRLIVSLIPLLTFLLYLPNVFRYELRPCLLSPGGPLSYQREDNKRFLDSVFYSVYKVRPDVTTKGESVLIQFTRWLLLSFDTFVLVVGGVYNKFLK